MKKRVYLVLVSFRRVLPYRLEEDTRLVETLGWEVVEKAICLLRRKPNPATFLGKGWVEKIAQHVKEESLDGVVVDPDLSSLQHRELEKRWQCPVWDRTAIILSIFGQRARTSAGKLQVDLAHLLYEKSRLVGAWSHLERQRGGFGTMGGPGESQLELDKRILQSKILKIEKSLEKVKKTRSLHRKNRQGFPIITLVGYTNAGKSTLFHALTHADILMADMPFATLDPTLRKLCLPSGKFCLMSDTVGFISELPSFLTLAFQSTLEEILHSDLVLHVRDGASEYTEQQKKDVETLLKKIGYEGPILEVINKADQAPSSLEGLRVSALHKTGILDLKEAIEKYIPSHDHLLKDAQEEEKKD